MKEQIIQILSDAKGTGGVLTTLSMFDGCYTIYLSGNETSVAKAMEKLINLGFVITSIQPSYKEFAQPYLMVVLTTFEE